ncbi:TCP domain-containing protein [Psidium guajava]|nr:TCP domain-containing protein [Psidium guajava]
MRSLLRQSPRATSPPARAHFSLSALFGDSERLVILKRLWRATSALDSERDVALPSPPSLWQLSLSRAFMPRDGGCILSWSLSTLTPKAAFPTRD